MHTCRLERTASAQDRYWSSRSVFVHGIKGPAQYTSVRHKWKLDRVRSRGLEQQHFSLFVLSSLNVRLVYVLAEERGQIILVYPCVCVLIRSLRGLQFVKYLLG